MSNFKAKMHKIPFPLGLPAGGAYSAPTDPLAVFKGPTSKGKQGEDGGKKKGKERGRGRMEGKGREGTSPPNYFGLEPPLFLPEDGNRCCPGYVRSV